MQEPSVFVGIDCHSIDSDFVCVSHKNESVFVGKESYSDDTHFVSISSNKKRCSPRLKTNEGLSAADNNTQS